MVTPTFRLFDVRYSRQPLRWSAHTEDPKQHCPACGEVLPEVDGQAPCLCPYCGCRCCEGGV